MRRGVWALLACAGCGGAPAGPVGGAAGPAPETVVLLSLDGFRHDYPERGEAPTFRRLEAEGAFADRLRPVFPSNTFPNHAALATGASAGRHGILNNAFLDRERGLFRYSGDLAWYEVPPLWIHAERLGLRTHVFHWVGIEGAWEGVSAAVGLAFDKSVTDDAKIDRILEWVGAPAAERPRLVMSYLHGCDDAGHAHGPDSPEVAACIAETDARLARLLAGLDPARVAVVLVSDHGMTATEGEIDPEAPFDGIAEVVAAGPVAHVYLRAPEHRERALATARSLPRVTVYEREALPAAWRYEHPRRTGDLVLLADRGWHFLPGRGAEDGPPRVPGHHGHPPGDPDMDAVFYAWGAGVRRGASLAEARAVDVVPTVCRLLGIDPPAHAEGRPLTELLAAP